MQTTVKRMIPLNELIQINEDGSIIIEGKENPTDLQIAQALRKYARQYGNVNKVNNDERFMLKNVHPMVGDAKGTIKTKGEWMQQQGWDEAKFDVMRGTSVLVKR
ncbi:hypothetical protein N8508_00430 [bacterium]|nr:hypothetical protein [bacterium]